MLQATPISRRRGWEWSTFTGHVRGLRKKGRKEISRVPWRGEWVYLGLLAPGDAARRNTLAYRLKRGGAFDACEGHHDVRRLVLDAEKTRPQPPAARRPGEAGFPVSVWDGEKVVELGPFASPEAAEAARANALRRRGLGLPVVEADEAVA